MSDWSSDVCSSDLFEHVWDTCVRIIAFYVLACFFFLQIPGIAASLGGGAAAMVSQFGNAVMSVGGAVATGAGHAASDARALGASMGRGFSSAVRRWRTRNTLTRAVGHEYAQVSWTRNLAGAGRLRRPARNTTRPNRR